MKRNYLVVVFLVLIFSLTFVSASWFGDFFKKATGGVVGSDKVHGVVYGDNTNNQDNENLDLNIADKSQEINQVKNNLNQEINVNDFEEDYYFENYDFLESSDNDIKILEGVKVLDKLPEEIYQEKNLFEKFKSFFKSKDKDTLYFAISFENLLFDSNFSRIVIHDVVSNSKVILYSNFFNGEIINFSLNSSALQNFNISIENSNLLIYTSGSPSSSFLEEDYLFEETLSLSKEIISSNHIVYLEGISGDGSYINIFINGENLNKFDVISNYTSLLGLSRSFFKLKGLMNINSFIIAEVNSSSGYQYYSNTSTFNIYLGEKNVKPYPYLVSLEKNYIGYLENVRSQVAFKSKELEYPLPDNLIENISNNKFKEVNVLVLNSFENYFNQINLGQDAFYSNNSPLKYNFFWNDQINEKIEFISIYRTNFTSGYEEASQIINLSKLAETNQNQIVYSLLKKPLELKIDYQKKLHNLISGKTINNESVSIKGPYYDFSSTYYDPMGYTQPVVYPGYLRIMKPNGEILDSVNGGIGFWELSCSEDCFLNSVNFQEIGYCDNGTYKVEWLYTNVSIGDTFFLEDTFEIEDCEIILNN